MIQTSHIPSSTRTMHIFSFLLLCFFTVNASAIEPDMASSGEEIPEIQLDEGEQEPLHFPSVPTRIAVGDPEVADVSLTSAPQDLLITGKKAGTTNLLIWGKAHSAPSRYNLKVNHRLIEGESKSLTEHAAIVPGEEPNPADATVVNLGGTQIQADIKIVEISRTGLKDAGMGFLVNKNSGNTQITTGSPHGLSPAGAQPTANATDAGSLLMQSAAGFFPYSQAYQLVLGNSGQGWLSSISLLEQGGYAHTLAEPSLVVMSGQTANFLAGGEFPVPVPQGGNTAGSITIRYKEFGVRLLLTPTLLDGNRIVMKVAPEVSELDFSAGIVLANTRVPALKVRRTDTSIELGDGESFVISGLISQTTISNEDKFPWLGDLPYIGAFFRSKHFERSDKELMMVVTPHIVHPFKRDEKLPPLPGAEYRRPDPDYGKFLFHPQEPSNLPAKNMEGFSK